MASVINWQTFKKEMNFDCLYQTQNYTEMDHRAKYKSKSDKTSRGKDRRMCFWLCDRQRIFRYDTKFTNYKIKNGKFFFIKL